MRSIFQQLADTVADGLSTTAALTGGIVGALIGYYNFIPTSWSADWRLGLAGAIAVVGAITAVGLAELFLMPIRRSLISKRTPSTGTAFTLPGEAVEEVRAVTPGEALEDFEDAVEDAAASCAAIGSRAKLDATSFLTNDDRWQGYNTGEATFYLADGVLLHCKESKTEYGARDREFHVYVSDSPEPIKVRTMVEIYDLMSWAAAGKSSPSSSTRPADQATTLT